MRRSARKRKKEREPTRWQEGWELNFLESLTKRTPGIVQVLLTWSIHMKFGT